MKLVSRKMLVVGAITAIAGSALVGPSMASAAKKKSYTLKTTAVCKADSAGNFSGTVKGTKPFGKGTCSGKLVIPNATITFHFKGGTFTYKSASTFKSGKFYGKATVTKGTGKFKGIKGKGTSIAEATGNATATFKLKF